MTAKKDCPEPTREEAQKIVDEARDKDALAPHTDPSSGIIMTPYSPDPTVLTYDPNDVEYDEKVKKQAAKNRKA